MSKVIKSKCIVVDADILQRASDAGPPGSEQSLCESFLRSILSICHQVVVTDQIIAEWNNHSSYLSIVWLRQMANRGKLYEVEDISSCELRQTVRSYVAQALVTVTLEKDAHLIEACRRADLIVASGDRRARRGFALCASEIDWLNEITWVNPATDPHLVAWLKGGALQESSRQLSALNPSHV